MRALIVGILLALAHAASLADQAASEGRSGDRRRMGREIRLFNG